MKIAIPTDYDNIDTSVCMSFGRTPFFMIYDTETEKRIFINNSAASSQGGAGILAAQSIADNKANVVLTPRCGENAAQVLIKANIKIYKTENGSAMDNIRAFLKGELSVLDNIHSGFHNHGNK